MSEHSTHSIARYIDVEIDPVKCIFGIIQQDAPIVYGDCNVLRVRLTDEPPQDALADIHLINPTTHYSAGVDGAELTDGMEITIPNDERLFNGNTMKIFFSVIVGECRKSSPRAATISITVEGE